MYYKALKLSSMEKVSNSRGNSFVTNIFKFADSLLHFCLIICLSYYSVEQIVAIDDSRQMAFWVNNKCLSENPFCLFISHLSGSYIILRRLLVSIIMSLSSLCKCPQF